MSHYLSVEGPVGFWDFKNIAASIALTSAFTNPLARAGGNEASEKPHKSTDSSVMMAKFARFGDVTIYNPGVKKPTALFIFLSGDGGWNSGVVDMARAIAAKDAIVAGVSVPAYMKAIKATKSKCHYPAGDLESLSHFIQKKLDLKSYIKPVLVGYSSGATLAYATMVQAPEGSYEGAITLGFCPDFIVDRPLCKGGGLESVKRKDGKSIDFLPADISPSRWFILNGMNDQVCKIDEQRAFITKIPTAALIELPKVGHGFGVTKNWLPQFIQSANEFKKPAESRAAFIPEGDLADLPIIETDAADKSSKYFAVILSGDGGWAGIDRALSVQLRDDGIKSVGLDSLRYFWQEKTPEVLSRDLTKIAKFYSKKWGLNKILWIGYSFGADVLPFAISRFSQDILTMTDGAVYVGPSTNATFEFHVTDWLDSSSQDGENVPKEIAKLDADVPQLCIFADEEKESPCRIIKGKNFTAKPLSGGHHFGGDYDALANLIEDFADAVATRPSGINHGR